ncbi:MAG: beta-propeller domain-containing protein [Methanoregula sp.]
MSHKKLTLIACSALVLVLAAVIAGGCMSSTVTAPSGTIKKFSSEEEIREYIANTTQLTQTSHYGTGNVWAGDTIRTTAAAVSVQESSAKSLQAPAALPSALGGGTTDYSGTNVQVAGVDEPDFVKNDARYIYVVTGNTLAIVDAYPATSASVISKTDLSDTPQEIFINGDRLVLFTTGQVDIDVNDTVQASGITAKSAIMPRYPYSRTAPVTHAIFYDISDRAHPKVLKDYTIDGNYENARMIGDTVYLLSRESVYPYYDQILIPAVRENTKVVFTPDVYYFDNPEQQYDFTTITSFDVASGNTRDAKTYLIGSGNTVYVSPDAMYVSYQKYYPIYRTMWGGAEPAIAVAPVSGGIALGISQISSAIAEDFNTMTEPEKQAAIAELKSGSRTRSKTARSTRARQSSTRSGSATARSRTSRKGRWQEH